MKGPQNVGNDKPPGRGLHKEALRSSRVSIAISASIVPYWAAENPGAGVRLGQAKMLLLLGEKAGMRASSQPRRSRKFSRTS